MLRSIFFMLLAITAVLTGWSALEWFAAATLWMAPFVYVGICISLIVWVFRLAGRK